MGLQVRVTDLVTVSKRTLFLYRFPVAEAVAEFPDFLEVLLETFQIFILGVSYNRC